MALHLRNQFLSSLPLDEAEILRPHLRTVELPEGEILAEAGIPIERAYFPEGAIISVVVAFANGARVDVAMIGRDSVVGASTAINGGMSPANAIVRLPGVASALDAARLRKTVNESAQFRAALLRHQGALAAQVQQLAGCNAVHGIEFRLRRCLLRMRDLAGGNRLCVTQELLADMLCAHRNSVSHIVNALRQANLITLGRGVIDIVNPEGLREGACECYQAVKLRYNRLSQSGVAADNYEER